MPAAVICWTLNTGQLWGRAKHQPTTNQHSDDWNTNNPNRSQPPQPILTTSSGSGLSLTPFPVTLFSFTLGILRVGLASCLFAFGLGGLRPTALRMGQFDQSLSSGLEIAYLLLPANTINCSRWRQSEHANVGSKELSRTAPGLSSATGTSS